MCLRIFKKIGWNKSYWFGWVSGRYFTPGWDNTFYIESWVSSRLISGQSREDLNICRHCPSLALAFLEYTILLILSWRSQSALDQAKLLHLVSLKAGGAVARFLRSEYKLFNSPVYWADLAPDIEDKPDKIDDASEPVLNDDVLQKQSIN